MLEESLPIRAAVLKLASHENPRVRRQVAWTLGQTTQPEAVPVLVALASRREPVVHVRSAALSSIRRENARSILRQYVELPKVQQVSALLHDIVTSAIRLGEVGEIEEVVRLVSATERRSLCWPQR